MSYTKRLIRELDVRVRELRRQRDELLETLQLVATMPGFEADEIYGQRVLAAIERATSSTELGLPK